MHTAPHASGPPRDDPQRRFGRSKNGFSRPDKKVGVIDERNWMGAVCMEEQKTTKGRGGGGGGKKDEERNTIQN